MSNSIETIKIADDPNVIGVKLTGKLTGDSMAEFLDRIEQIKSAGGKARVYIDMSAYDGFEMPVVREKAAHMGTLWSSIDRCAYVVDKAWISKAIGLVDAVTPMHLKAFASDEDAAARAWVISGD
jgi:hypothetical protein